MSMKAYFVFFSVRVRIFSNLHVEQNKNTNWIALTETYCMIFGSRHWWLLSKRIILALRFASNFVDFAFSFDLRLHGTWDFLPIRKFWTTPWTRWTLVSETPDRRRSGIRTRSDTTENSNGKECRQNDRKTFWNPFHKVCGAYWESTESSTTKKLWKT